MPRLRRPPYNPALAAYQQQVQETEDARKRDRQSTDLLRNARVAPMDILEPVTGDKITVARSLRDDPLARLHVRDQIDDAQYHAGRRYQADFYTAERGPRAIDTTREAVDGGQRPEPITERQRAAAHRLSGAYRALGKGGSALITDVLVHGLNMAQIAERRGVRGESWERYHGMRFREHLDVLAVFYDLAMAPE